MALDFARQITENQQRLYGYIRSLVGNSAWSWDILQETNLVIWEKQASFAAGTNFRAWAFRIAKFQVLAFLRDRKREPFMLLTPDLLELLNDDAEDLAEQHVERLQALARCRENLNDSNRRLLATFLRRRTEYRFHRRTPRSIAQRRQTSHLPRSPLADGIYFENQSRPIQRVMPEKSSPENTPSLIEETLFEIREKNASSEDIQKLRTLLATSKEARREYLLSQQLTAGLESHEMIETSSRKNILSAPFRYRKQALIALVSGGIAACLTVLLHALFTPASSSPSPPQSAALPAPPPPSFASLSSAYDAIIGGTVVRSDAHIGEGTLVLDQGIAQLAFRNGAQVILEGQCGFEILNETTVALHHGKLWAHCPRSAHGFQVVTPDGSHITDLGTEFGVAVDSQGSIDVHVFDGRVEVAGPDLKTQVLKAGSSLSWQGSDSLTSQGTADPAQFVDSTQLLNKRLATHQKTIRKDPSLILNYDFSDTSRRVAVNSVANPPPGTFGKLVGPTFVRGRGPGHQALQFEHPGDHIDLEVDALSQYNGATICVWVKLDRFDHQHAVLINSDNYDLGAIHFQITKTGHLKSSINGGPHYTSKERLISPGKWHHLAVSWDFKSLEGTLYLDGQALVSNNRLETKPTGLKKEQIHLGPCQIGSWSATDLKKRTQARPVAITRELKGRIDEVLIFARSFSDSEIFELYEASKP